MFFTHTAHFASILAETTFSALSVILTQYIVKKFKMIRNFNFPVPRVDIKKLT